jgi:photoactive yellow protein
MEMIKLGADHADNLLAQDPARLDLLPFGAILVDCTGRVLKYNADEGARASRPASEVIGRNFFKDVAPFASGQQFQGRFEQGVARGTVNSVFEYAFEDGAQPAKLRVHMKSAAMDEGVWIFIKRM